ncbi:hypothetical protein PpBr36_03907 [Pyricularia pennisetigena]|uniref:hypothetical protein n=1 Tax=Pyricularia pennisetigena TaxID=1578925 RepID=UPI0011534C12|nr:hypothetical protein PpBr36_03907 [Pyricularia pennisetigena]TLS31581.1 hypothetical protein PpBr36_03907 [Pyricularia pennisetigena]
MASPRKKMTQSWLPTDLIELQLGQIDLLLAMYPESTTIDVENRHRVEALRSCVDGDSASDLPASLSLVLSLDLDQVKSGSRLDLEISFAFTQSDDNSNPVEPRPPRARVLQPTWLSRADTSRLNSSLSQDLLIDVDKDALEAHMTKILATILGAAETADQQQQPQPQQQQQQQQQKQQQNNQKQPNADAALVRVWFYFPSISTRSKRDDLVEHAPRHGLTGFLISGKPGVLCVEGTPADIDAYMRFVRTESWRDIPAAHKKVSERLREEGGGVRRVFEDMREVDCGDMGGERRGERANRLDMRALENWLAGKGVGDAFGKVFM